MVKRRKGKIVLSIRKSISGCLRLLGNTFEIKKSGQYYHNTIPPINFIKI